MTRKVLRFIFLWSACGPLAILLLAAATLCAQTTYQFAPLTASSLQGTITPGGVDPVLGTGTVTVDVLDNGKYQTGTISVAAPASVSGTDMGNGTVTLGPAVFTVSTTGLNGLSASISANAGQPAVAGCSGSNFSSPFTCATNGLVSQGNTIRLDLFVVISDAAQAANSNLVQYVFRYSWSIATGASSVAIDHVEIVQVVQKADSASNQTIPLVADKSTVVRVFGKSAQPVGVTATLSATDRRVTPLTLQGTVESANPKPDTQGDSLDFLLPGTWTSAGTLTLQAQFTPGGGTPASAAVPTVTFKPAPNWPQPLRVAALKVCEAVPPASGVGPSSTVCAGSPSAPLDDLGGFLRKIFPLPEIEPQYQVAGTVLLTNPTYHTLQYRVARIYLNLLHQLGTQAPDFLVAWFSSQGALGQSATHSAPLRLGAVGKVAFPLADSMSANYMQLKLATLLAYFEGATVGIFDGAMTGITGYDPDAMTVEASTLSSLHVFGADSSFTWVSAAQYNSLYNAYASSGSTHADRGSQALDAASPSQYLLISGTVQADGSAGTLDPGTISTSSYVGQASSPSGNYCLHFTGGSGTPGDYCFAVSFQDPSGQTDSSAPFAVRAPFPAGATAVSLVTNSASGEGPALATITKSATPPTVQITSPHTGDKLTAGTLTLTWTGSASNGATLAYDLLSSPDGGTTWNAIDGGITDTQYQLDATQIPGGSQVMFQIVATDGLSTTTATIGPLTISQTPKISPPTATIAFGKALVGAGASHLIPIANTGTGPLIVNTAAFDNAAFLITAPALPFTINAGATLSIDARFLPTTSGVTSAHLTITSNDPAQPAVKVPVSGEAITAPAPTVNLPPQAVDLGTVAIGMSGDGTLLVGNLGPGTMTVSKIQSNNTAFSVTGTALPFTVSAGGQQPVTVHFAPTTTGLQMATLTFSTDDPDALTATAMVTGTGTASGSATPSISAAGVLNAASYLGGGVSPGEIIAIFGSNMGPAALTGLQVSNGKLISSLAGTQVLFDGVPAPLIYTLAGQLSAVVPYEVFGESFTQMQVVYNGTKSNIVTLPVVQAAPALFSASAAGTGPGAILNPDYTLNTAANPAVPGSYAVLYGTGEGQTSPAGVDGLLTSAAVLPSPLASVSATIGGVNAPVLYAGASPSLVEGVLQVNIQIPNNAPAGVQPVVVKVGNASSQPGLTIAIKGNASGAPVIAVSPSPVSFPTTAVGQTSSPVTVTIQNTGTATLTVTAIGVGGIQFAATGIQPLPFNLLPGGQTSFQMTMAPVAAGPQTGTLTIASSDSNTPTRTVNLTGTAPAPPSFTAGPASVPFGNVTVGQTSPGQTVTVNNTGATSLTITAKTTAPFAVSPASLPLAGGKGGTFTVSFTPTATGAVMGSLIVSAGLGNDPAPITLSGTGVAPTGPPVIQTLIYNEITQFPSQVLFSNQGMPVLSAGGGRIVYANAPGVETNARYNDIFVMNADGTGQKEIDSYQQSCFCGAVVDISSDGNTVVSTDSQILRIATASGSTGRTLVTNRAIPYIRISSAGDKVYFINRTGSASMSDPTTERGLYVINADGTGLKQIVGPTAVGSLFGNTADQVSPFDANGWSLDVSADGTKLVFGVSTPAGQRLMAVSADGSGLHQLIGPASDVNHAALSADGTKVGYDVNPLPCCSTPNEVGVINFDGSGRKALATNLQGLSSNLRMEISGNGSQLLYGNTSRLYATDGSGVVQLSARGGYFSTDTAPLVGEGFSVPSMNSAGNLFLYAVNDNSGVPQLATVSLNQGTVAASGLGAAPAITQPLLSQPSIALNGVGQSVVTAVVAATNTITRVSSAVLSVGLTDPDANEPVMVGDGTADGIYTGTAIREDCCGVIGPRTVRVKAEVKDSGNRRHATAIEFGGLTVTATPTTFTASPASINFGNVTVGQSSAGQTVTVTNAVNSSITVAAKTAAPFTVSPASVTLAVGGSGTFTVSFAPAAASAITGSLTVSAGLGNDPAPIALSGTGVAPIGPVTQTLIYNEITQFTTQVRFSNQGMPVLSAAGGRIVYANAPGTETNARYNDIFVMNADGTGQKEIDSYQQSCFCGAVVDISSDGNTVVSTDSQVLRIATASGTMGRALVTNRAIPYIRISSAGDKVYFINRTGSASTSDPTTERGLYVINADGTGLKQIAGPTAVGTLFGITADQVFPFDDSGWSLDVSADGTKLVFGVSTPAGERLMAVGADGSGLHQLIGPVNNVNHAALSADGTKVGYDVTPPPCCSTPNEVGVINFDGSGRKALATNIQGLNSNLRMEISGNGSQLLYGNTSRLYATDGSAVVQLSVRGGYNSSDPAPLVGDGFSVPSMNSAGNLFLFAVNDNSGVAQLATVSLTQGTVSASGLGAAPAVTQPLLSQASIALNGAGQSTVTAVVAATNTITRVSPAVLSAGLPDPDANEPVMVDDGTAGDKTAGDGIYTGTALREDCCGVVGPRTVRVKAEVKDSGNRRHATAIEFGGLTVTAK